MKCSFIIFQWIDLIISLNEAVQDAKYKQFVIYFTVDTMVINKITMFDSILLHIFTLEWFRLTRDSFFP